jgi:hypothetical protein
VEVRLTGTPRQPFTACTGRAVAGAAPALVCLDELAPGQTYLLDVRLESQEEIRTGKQRVGVMVTGERGVPAAEAGPASGELPPFTVISTADVELSVFGLEALSPLGFGTALFVPGLVAVLTFLSLARWLYPRHTTLPETVSLTDLRALPAVVLGAVGAYVVGFSVFGRNLTDRISTLGVVLLFLAGVVLGAVVWLVMAVVWYRRIGRKRFSVEDSVDTVLKRLAAAEASLKLPVATVGGRSFRQLGTTSDGRVLVAPPITYSFPSTTAPAARTAFRNHLGADDAAAIRKAGRAGDVSLKWETTSGVAAVAAEDASTTVDRQPLVIEDET